MQTHQICLILACLGSPLIGSETSLDKEFMSSQQEQTPTYLFKILSWDHWQDSQGKSALILSADDDAFIHFSKEDQLDRILSKYWSDVPQFVVIKIAPGRLEGEMVYEANPGGSAKYYHLYQGRVPFSSIIEAKIICR